MAPANVLIMTRSFAGTGGDPRLQDISLETAVPAVLGMGGS